jgi:putative ABC transport system substrate-binding protein
MRRRKFIVLAGCAAAAWPLAASAQGADQKGLPVVAFLGLGSEEATRPNTEAFRSGLAALGYMEDRNIRVFYLFADGNVERFTEMTSGAVSRGASIIVTSSTTAIQAAHRAAPSIAIVSYASGDPVLMGWAQTMARPGGMITGLFLVASTIAKPLELLKEMRPQATRFGYLFNATNPGNAEFRRIVEEAATRLGIKVEIIEVKESSELAEAFRRMRSYGAQGGAVIADPLFSSNLPMISRLAREHRIPTVADGRDFAQHGGLLAQFVDYGVLARRSAWYVDQILKGTPAGDLPAEQTTEYKLIVNLKTALELGLTIPPSILARAEEVID